MYQGHHIDENIFKAMDFNICLPGSTHGGISSIPSGPTLPKLTEIEKSRFEVVVALALSLAPFLYPLIKCALSQL